MCRAALLLLFCFLLPFPAWGFRLNPMVLNIPVNSGQASGTFTLDNNTKEKIALQFEVRERSISREGVETRPQTTGFLIYPEQVALEPGEKRNVRVSWQGQGKPEKEQAYRFIASQLPVDFKSAKPEDTRAVKLKFLIEYVASMYLVPPGMKPKIRVKSAKITSKGILELLVANEGNARQLLEHMALKIKSDGKELKIAEKNLENARTENLLAFSERLIKIPVPGAKAGDVLADLYFSH